MPMSMSSNDSIMESWFCHLVIVSWSHGFIGFVVSMVSWFHVFRGFIGFVVLIVSWFHRFRGVNGFIVS